MRIGENAPANCLLTTYRSVGFVAKKRVALGEFRFFPALPEISGEGDSLEQTNTQTPLNRLVHNVVKSLRPIRNKEKAGAACAK